MNRLPNIFFICYLLATTVMSQSHAVIRGQVVDRNTRLPLPDANIVLVGTHLGCAANRDGRFEFAFLTPGDYTVQVTHIGYQAQSTRIDGLATGDERNILFELTARVLELPAVTLAADKFSLKYQKEISQIGIQQIRPRQIRTYAGALDDVMRSVQIFSSAMPASDYNAYFAVRGGSPEQNLIIMDGVVIPSPYRFRLFLGGGLSIFDPNIIKDVRLHIGGFPVEFGNFLASVLEVDTRDGNPTRLSGRVSLNLVDASAVIEGPIPGARGSWLLAGRRTCYDLLARRFAQSNATYPNSTDLNAKLTWQITERNRLSVRGLNTREDTHMSKDLIEDYAITEASSIRLLSLDWLRIVSDQLSQRTILARYDETFDFDLTYFLLSEQLQLARLKSKIKNFSLRSDLIYAYSDRMEITGGLYYATSHTRLDSRTPVNPLGFARRDFPPSMQHDKTENYIAIYLDNSYQLTARLQLKTGLRYAYSDMVKKSLVSPRASFLLKLAKNTRLEGFWGICSQYPQIMSAFIRTYAMDLTQHPEQLSPERSWHLTFGLVRQFGSGIEGKIELYHREMTSLLFAANRSDFLAKNIGNGFSRGLEFCLQRQDAEAYRFSGILSYSYGLARYRETVNNIWLPFAFDRRHSFSYMGNIELLSNLKLNFLYRLASGLPYNFRRGLVLLEFENFLFLESDIDKKYFPAYQRLDLRLSYEHQRGNSIFSMYLDISNITNHHNIYDISWHLKEANGPTEKAQIDLRTLYMLPLIPSLGLSLGCYIYLTIAHKFSCNFWYN